MLERFRQFIGERHPFREKDKVLLAVSGGVDSVVMAHLFARAGFDFAIAHCNFQLRGEESNADELFVGKLAAELNVNFFSKRFDTEAAATAGVSIQMAARQLRYEWLEKLRADNGFHFIATAHHLDDSIETAVHNFIRGTGVSGLRGILPRSGKLIRPMLFARKEEITAFARSEGIAHREDRSNLESKYTRNRIRHQVLPLLRELNPGFDHSMMESARYHLDTEIIQKQVIGKVRRRLLTQRHNEWFIPILALKKIEWKRTALYEVLKDFGFNIEQVDDIIRHLDSQPGKQFETTDYRLIKDRRFLIITPREAGRPTWVHINADDEMIHAEGLTLRCFKQPVAGYSIDPSPQVASVDHDQLTFPLTLRRWKRGDYFFPFGMKGKKKVSKYFKDEKIPVTEKDRVWILLSGDRVVWIVGYRLDNRFGVSDKTKSVYRLEVIT